MFRTTSLALRATFALALLWLLATPRPVAAGVPASLEPVATVNLIDGRLGVKRPGLKTWYRGYGQMSLYVGDRVATDAASRAIIAFRVGGRVGLGKATCLELIGTPRSHGVESAHALRRVRVLRGAVWSKFDRQHEPFYFQTRRSLVAIHGTELVIEESGTPAGETSVEVLEGQVAYTPLPTTATPDRPAAPAEQTVPAGSKLSFDHASVPTVKNYGTDELRTEMDHKYPGLHDGVVRQILGVAAKYTPYAGFAMKVIDNPNRVAHGFISQELRKSKEGNILNDLANAINFGGDDPKKPDFPGELMPNQTAADPNDLRFAWKDYQNRPEFVVLVSRDEGMRTYDWTGRVKGTELPYTPDAVPLDAGQTYYWRVIGLGKDGKPRGKAAQSWFKVSPGYVPPAKNTELAVAMDAEVTTDAALEAAPAAPRPKAAPAKPRPAKAVARAPNAAGQPGMEIVEPVAFQNPSLKKPPEVKTTAVTIVGYAFDARGIRSVRVGGEDVEMAKLDFSDPSRLLRRAATATRCSSALASTTTRASPRSTARSTTWRRCAACWSMRSGAAIRRTTCACWPREAARRRRKRTSGPP